MTIKLLRIGSTGNPLYRVRITIKKKIKNERGVESVCEFFVKKTNKHKKRGQIQPVFNQKRFWRH
jgi:ribosomal protein S16